jgi:NAD(P)-dependent dehydrogenase (short-subunit alcohol dehydrogenase family)
MSRAFARRLLAAQRPGCIVNISSIAAKRLSPNAAAYSASKIAIHALAAAMAQELGPSGIRVNTLCPGPVDPYGTEETRNTDTWRNLSAMIPLRRPSDGSEIAQAAVFLCSEQGAWITGQAINVDGGMVVAH